MIPIKYVFLEGPDASGKTTLYRNLHKASGFGYNIVDRSRLSRLCYARLYGRENVEEERRLLLEELCNSSNYFVVMLPSLDVILDRYRIRGDEYQNEVSLKVLYQIFQEEIAEIQDLPNVIVLSSSASPEDHAAQVSRAMQKYSEQCPRVFGRSIYRWASLTPAKEVQFSATLRLDPEHIDPEVLANPKESEYYAEITGKCVDIISRELRGENPYNKPQDLSSRRFYYSSDTCISSIHFLPRNGSLKVVCCLRSTDTVSNGEIDTRFLAHLSAEIPRVFGWAVKDVELVLYFNSAHIRTDL